MKGLLHLVNNLLRSKKLTSFSKIIESQMARERFFLILLISILVVIWFKKGLILGSGESGLPFYNTPKLLELSKNSWTDVPLGTNSVIGTANYPYYAVLTFLHNLNIPFYVLQAALYWLLFVCGVLAIHKLSSLFKESAPLSRLSSALFYIFNPIVHISVLHRFQYTLMFFYFFMPLAFLIYLQGLKSKKFIYLVILSLICVIFSPLFIGIALLEMFFGVLGFLSIGYFLYSFKEKKDWFPLFYFLGFVVTFILIHAWWLTPLFVSAFRDLGSSGSVKYFSTNVNVETFKSISEHLVSVLSVFRLFPANAFPINEAPWHWIYSTMPFVVLSFFSTIAFIVGLFKKDKQFLYKFLILVSLITMFWMKGSLPPLGDISLYLFKSLTFLHGFRNPFEKIGMLLPFAMAIPIGFGVSMIINFLSSRIKLQKYIITVLFLIVVFPIYMFPIVTGLSFTGGPPPANKIDIGQYVKVPDYYKEASDWLDKQEELFRILVLPINGEGMTYKWEYGYSGVELSNNIFNKSMISFNSSQAFLPEMVNTVTGILAKFPEKLWVMAQLMNVKYIMIRDDIDYLERDTEAPETVLNVVKESMNNHFSQVANFSKLKFFEINSNEFYPRIFASTLPVYLFDPLKNATNLIPFTNPKARDVFITTSKSTPEDPYLKLSKKIVISGIRVENVKIDTKNPVENLPFVSIYRDTPFYALVRLKEELENQLLTPDTQLAFRVNLLGKRLKEINYSPQDTIAIDEYTQLFKSISKELTESASVERSIVEALINQKLALEEIKNKMDDKTKIDWVVANLDRLLIDIRVKSIYPTDKNLIHRFYIPKSSKYEILISKENWNTYFKNTEILEFDLDGEAFKISLTQQTGNKDTFLLGTYQLNEGIHEVSIAQPQTVNLVAEELPEELVLSSQDKQPFTKIIPINELSSTNTYQLSFEYLEEKGNVPVISLHSDVDFIDKKGERIPRFGIALARDNYDFGWKRYTATFTPLPASHKYSISFKVIPFGDCKAVVRRPYRRYCEDNSFNQRFLKDSTTKIRNLKVEKMLHNPVFLRESEIAVVEQAPPEVNFEQMNPARYKVRVNNSQEPFFLVLSTAFDHRWNAYFTTDRPRNIIESVSESISGDLVPSKNHLVVNGYANAWYIEKLGSFEMFLEYSPERGFIIGQKFSVVVIIISLLGLVTYKIYARYINR